MAVVDKMLGRHVAAQVIIDADTGDRPAPDRAIEDDKGKAVGHECLKDLGLRVGRGYNHTIDLHLPEDPDELFLRFGVVVGIAQKNAQAGCSGAILNASGGLRESGIRDCGDDQADCRVRFVANPRAIALY